jgi:hypothetical protein
MARLVDCRLCRVELETFKVAGGRAMVVCVDCATMGFSHEVAAGGPLWAVEIGPPRRRPTRKSRNSKGLRAAAPV